MKNQNKKLLPYAVTKSELIRMYSDQFSERKIRSHINEILREKNISKQTKMIPHLEFMEFVETYGLPKGYHNQEEE